MSKADDILEKTKRRELEAKKWKVVVGIVVGLVLACVFLGVVFWFADVDDYLKDTKQIVALYDFYDEKSLYSENSVYFIGSSMVGFSINSTLINAIISENGHNYTAYNIGIGSDTPIQRSLEVEKIISSSPSLVVIGITYGEIEIPNIFWGDGWIDSERVYLVQDRLMVNDSSLYLYSEYQLDEIQGSKPLNYYSKFLRGAFIHKITSPDSDREWDWNGDPWNKYRRFSNTKDISTLENTLKKEPGKWDAIVTSESTKNKEALIYIVNRLQSADIPVVIVNLPLHPILSENISEETRRNTFDLFNQTNAKNWYDFERDYGDIFFCDSHHASVEGAELFAPVMADLIIQEMS